MVESITIEWNGLTLTGTFDKSARGADREPCFVVLHGFGSTKDSGSSPEMSGLLNSRGYATLRVDMPGCGESEGPRGRHVCLEQVAVAKACVDYLVRRPDVDEDRIGMAGASFGAAVSIYTAGEDERVAAVISSGGWGNGERKAKLQHPPPAAWGKFSAMIVEGREKIAKGETMMVPRYDIVPIPEHLRANIDQLSLMEFHVETAISIYDFRPEEMVGRIAPRPLLLFHPTDDSVTPASETVELFKRAGRPTDCHFLAEVDHFVFSEEDPRVTDMIDDWLGKYFPV